MCRVLAYLGRPIELANVLFVTDNSLMREVHEPRMTSTLNLRALASTPRTLARRARPSHSSTGR
jgi:hypothetical protein